jgi:hypothetical protein
VSDERSSPRLADIIAASDEPYTAYEAHATVVKRGETRVFLDGRRVQASVLLADGVLFVRLETGEYDPG